MKPALRIEFDGVRVRTRRELPAPWRGYVRRLQRRARIRASGALMLAANMGGQVLRIYTSGSGTETCPTGYSAAHLECWAGGAGGGPGSGVGCTLSGGGGGGAGGLGRSAGFVVTGKGGLTWNYSVGAGGGSIGGTASSITAGTMTGWTTITCTGGSVGLVGPAGVGGAGGASSGGTTANITGATGSAGTAGSGGNGAPGTAGAVPGDGSPYGIGGHGGRGTVNTGQTAGTAGAAVFLYS